MNKKLIKISKNNFCNNEDFYKILNLEREIFKNSSYSEKDYEDLIKNSNVEIFYILKNNEVISYLTTLNSLYNIDILKIATKKSYRRKNYAKLLIEKLLTLYRDKEILLEVRESNEEAIKFYLKNNFKKIFVRKKYYSDTNEDAIIMKLVTGGKDE